MHVESGYRGLLCVLRAPLRGLRWCAAYINMSHRHNDGRGHTSCKYGHAMSETQHQELPGTSTERLGRAQPMTACCAE